MAPAAIGTVVLTAVLVAGLAVWLIVVATSLQKVSGNLDIVLGAVTGIAGQVKPAPGVVGSIARDVGAIQGALHGLIALATGGAAPAPPPPPRATATRVASRGSTSSLAAVDDAPAQRSGPNLPPPVHRRRN
jgi:hypothetical protein